VNLYTLAILLAFQRSKYSISAAPGIGEFEITDSGVCSIHLTPRAPSSLLLPLPNSRFMVAERAKRSSSAFFIALYVMSAMHPAL
jgi:hypothetical protein